MFTTIFSKTIVQCAHRNGSLSVLSVSSFEWGSEQLCRTLEETTTCFIEKVLSVYNHKGFREQLCRTLAAVAASLCYWERLMLLKCQINTNTNKNGFLLPTKCLEWVLKYSFLVSIILNFYLCLQIFKVKFVTSIILDEEWYVSEKLFFALNKTKRWWCDYYLFFVNF